MMPTDNTGRHAVVHGQQAGALQTRVAYEDAHPEITITSPLTSRSRLWELSAEGETTAFSGVWAMLDCLAAQYGAADEG
jgi:hypothetical protein